MQTQTTKDSIVIRAAFGSYLALSGIWVLIAFGYILLSIKTPGKGMEVGVAIAGGVALVWWFWLLGFKISVSKDWLEYRDGLYRSTRIPLSDVTAVTGEYVVWKRLGRRVRIPCLTVSTTGSEVAIRINPKPFGRHDLNHVKEILKRHSFPESKL